MKPRLILVSLGLAMLSFIAIGISAQEQAKTAQDKDDIVTSEQQLLRQFSDFQDLLLRLKQKLARGTPEERRRAEVLGKVLEECRNLAINQEFAKMIELIKKSNLNTTPGLEDAYRQSEILTTSLAKILDMLRNSSEDRLSEQRKALEDFIKALQKNIDKQQDVRGLTEFDRTKRDELAKLQEKTAKETANIAKEIGKFLDKDGKGKEGKPSEGDNKTGGKDDGKKGEAKDAGQQGKEGQKGESKDGGKENQGAKGEAKTGEKNDKSGEGEPKGGAKAGDKGKEGAKAGEKGSEGAKGKEGDAKSGEGAKGKEGGAKDSGGKDPMKGDGQQGAAKGGDDKKAGGEKGKPDSSAKPAQPGGDKQAGAKDSKGDPKAGGDAKAGGDPKAGDAKQGEAKSGDAKSGQAKAGGEPGPAGEPKPGGQGQAKDGPPQNAKPGGSKEDADIAAAKKKIEEAGYPQGDAADKIQKKDNPGAAKDQAKAIEDLESAKKKLEKLLKQLREEEIERVLAALKARCEKMLVMQTQVLAGTIDTDLAIKKNVDKKASFTDKRASLKLADNEKDIVQEVNKCIDILESEGSAVAFPEVFQQLRQDMIHVQKRLEQTDVHDLTQNIEKDIIVTLKEMIDALTEAQKDNKSDPGKPGKAGKPGQPKDQKLLELIQELKMVRALQKRVNDRTVDYAKRFPNQEQTADPQIVRDLRILAERQQRIQQIVERIAKGDNK